tara:strand:- start:2104 stop:2331 length:228 start_codon:yes stop_codon:yes gene_type:complete
MSRALKFYGASDDLFEIEGTTGDEPDEVGCYDSFCGVTIEANDGVLNVVGYYGPFNTACWMIGIMPVDEDIAMPH